MLPKINIDLKTIGFRGDTLIGNTFLFDWTEVIAECKMAKVSLDVFLTIRIGSFIQSKGYRVPILVLFAPYNDAFKIIICSKKDINFYPCLHMSSGMVGYLESCQEEVAKIAKGFLFFSGTELFRIYHLISPIYDEEFLASDFCNGFGLHVSSAESEFYKVLVNNPGEYPAYSFVPQLEIEQIVTPQNKLVIKHSYSQFI